MGFIAGIGAINCDLLYGRIPKIPNEGEEVYSDTFDLQLGGGVPAILVNLSRLGISVKLFTFLGEDLFSSFARKELMRFQIPFYNLGSRGEIPIHITSVMITGRDRTFLSYGRRKPLTREDIRILEEEMGGSAIMRMYVDPGNRELLEFYRERKQEGCILTFDTGWEDDLSIDKYLEYIQLADYYTPNLKEALKITERDTVEEAAKVLSRYFDQVIIKLGGEGCYYESGGRKERIPPMDGVRAVDPTGAGDAFHAGLMYGLYHHCDIETCIQMGTVMGGYCVKEVGCLTSYPDLTLLQRLAGLSPAEGEGITGKMENSGM